MYDSGSNSLWRLIGMQDPDSSGMLDGLAVSGNNNNLCLEAMVPNIDPKTIKVTFNKGFLTIKAKRSRKN